MRIDPEHAPAHQGLGAVLSDIGERAAARHHFDKGFRGHAISTLPYRGAAPPVALLQLVSSGGGNIPTASFLDDRVFLTSVIVADYFDPAGPLPPHQLVFNAIGDADLCQPALEAAARLMTRTRAPVINDPRAVMKTGRIGNAGRLRAIPGVVTPRTLAIDRRSWPARTAPLRSRTRDLDFRCCCAHPAITPGTISSWSRRPPGFRPPRPVFPATICW